MSQSVHPAFRGAMILSMLLTGKYYTTHPAPLMSHKFWTITTLALLQDGRFDKWRSLKIQHLWTLKGVFSFGRLKLQNDFVLKSEI